MCEGNEWESALDANEGFIMAGLDYLPSHLLPDNLPFDLCVYMSASSEMTSKLCRIQNKEESEVKPNGHHGWGVLLITRLGSVLDNVLALCFPFAPPYRFVWILGGCDMVSRVNKVIWNWAQSYYTMSIERYICRDGSVISITPTLLL